MMLHLNGLLPFHLGSKSRSLFLLLQSEPTHKTASRAAGVFSHYMLQASPSLSLLLKPVVSRELLLPCSVPPCTQEPCPEATSTVQASLQQLDEESVFNPLLLNSNLYVQLRSHGLLFHGRYTYKTAAKTQSQPAEGSRSSGSRQPRQVPQENSKQ
uniref:Uncharacterized protein n=1 Tax=Knipowitschia caucasica TaxID=637954 RepID=A0AAV2KM54_KNICA